MTLPEAIRTVRWMIRDTFRQSVASKLFWVMLAVTTVATGVGLSVRVSGDPKPVESYEVPAVLPEDQLIRIGLEQFVKQGALPGMPTDFNQLPPIVREKALEVGRKKAEADGVRMIAGHVSFGFGAVTVPLQRPRDDAVRFVQVWLAAAVADTVGVLLTLLWTAGFLPTFLEPQAATVLLAKPAPRWSILLGKYLGVVLFVTLQAILFVSCTWAALGFTTGVWTGAYWLAVPLLAMNFAVFFAVSAFLAVWTRSTVASGFGTLLFWLLCWVMNYTHHRMIAVPVDGLTPMTLLFSEIGYWVLPKPLDMGGIFYLAMGGEAFSTEVPELRAVRDAGRYQPELSVLASLGFAIGVLGLASYEFEMTDY